MAKNRPRKGKRQIHPTRENWYNEVLKRYFYNRVCLFIIPSVRISITMSLRPCTCPSVCPSFPLWSVRLSVRPLVIREDAKVAIEPGRQSLLHFFSIKNKFYRLGQLYLSLYLHRGVSLCVRPYVSLEAVRENHQKLPKKTIWTRKNDCMVLWMHRACFFSYSSWPFLDAFSHLYKRVCPSVGRAANLSMTMHTSTSENASIVWTPFDLFFNSYIGNNGNPPIMDKNCWPLEICYSGIQLYLGKISSLVMGG